MIYPGRVSNVMDFGCFVQLEGCKGRAEGLVHISLISQGQLRTPHNAVKRGQPCFVKVLWCTGSQITPTPTPSPTKAGKFHEILKAGLKLHCNYTVITLHL